MRFSVRDMYGVMLKEYPDLLNIEQTGKTLGVSTKTVYKLLKEKKIASMKVGRAYRIPKVHLLAYLNVVESEKMDRAS